MHIGSRLSGVAILLVNPWVISDRAFADPLIVDGVDCSKAQELGYDKMDNARAGLILMGCGLASTGDPEVAEELSGSGVPPPPSFHNVDVITISEIWPHVTQSESMVWSNGATVVVNYNNSQNAPRSYAGLSVSIDSGQTFTEIQPSPLDTGHKTNYGDPIVVFNAALNQWFAGDLVTGCGTQGIGFWTSADGINWEVGSCAHNGSSDDRESMWVDNNSDSPYFGRMYVSWNDFAKGQGIYVTYSDDGESWAPQIRITQTFVRNVQMTGSQESDGTVYIVGMDENNGSDPRSQNLYRSFDGGNTWTSRPMGRSFHPPGAPGCGYFWRIPPIWRHMGWGQPAVGPGGVIHYAFTARGLDSGDLGDIVYIQSKDQGDTWSDPVILNTDAGSGSARAQWMPSLSVTTEGMVVAAWYDRRNSPDGTSYEYWMRISNDNGATWLDDVAMSEAISPQPLQPDPQVQSCYAGDYNYHTTYNGIAYLTWADGRNLNAGRPQQDVYLQQVPECPPTTAVTGGLPGAEAASSGAVNGTRRFACLGPSLKEPARLQPK